MIEILTFIFRDIQTFLGTLVLIMVTGLAGNMIMQPFGKPRTLVMNDNYYGDIEEDSDEDNQD